MDTTEKKAKKAEKKARLEAARAALARRQKPTRGPAIFIIKIDGDLIEGWITGRTASGCTTRYAACTGLDPQIIKMVELQSATTADVAAASREGFFDAKTCKRVPREIPAGAVAVLP